MHESHDARRHVLNGAPRLAVGADALCIAFGTRDVGCIERQLRAGAILPALLARLADRRLDLVLCAASLITTEHGVAQRCDQAVVVEALAALGLEDLLRLAQECERRRPNVEANRRRDELRVSWIARPIAALAAGDRLLDLAQVLAARIVEPGALGLASRDARQLAHRAEVKLAASERVGELGQILESGRDPHALGRLPRRVAEDRLEVFVKRRVAEPAPDLDANRARQQASFFGIERAPPLSYVAKCTVDNGPFIRLNGEFSLLHPHF
jgi:hypothetical protein